jgi:hypothetical protein
MGENNMVVVMDEMTGKTVSLKNPNGLELEIGSEGTVEFDALSAQLMYFEAALAEEKRQL